MKKYICVVLSLFIYFSAYSQTLVDFSTIPKSGTIMVFAHQDDDVIWMLPFWSKTEKFILGAYPTTPAFKKMIHYQQTYLNANNYNINYEANWICPWDTITQQQLHDYYWWNDTTYSYLANDHVTAFWDKDQVTINEIKKIKAKIEPYIASISTSRIITHDNWGEYGHQHHRALNNAVRELAVKYKKDVWMLGCTITPPYMVGGVTYNDVVVPPGITYTVANFNGTLYTGLKQIYLTPTNDLWTWDDNYIATGDHKFIKIVDAGIDKSNILIPGTTVTTTGPSQSRPGDYIFDGVDDYLTLPGNNYSSFTIAMWVMPDQLKSMDISKMTEYPSANACDRSFYMNNNGTVTTRILNNKQSQTITSNTSLSAGNWAHILMTGNGSSLRLYINGLFQKEITTGALYSTYSSPEFVIGQAQETSSFFKGQISDVRLYDYILSSAEIAALINSNPPVIHTITASFGPGGTITSPGDVIVNEGTDRVYTITPDDIYQISDVKVDNISVGAISSYTFSNITANHTISATFSLTLPNIALNKPASCSNNVGNIGYLPPSKANDADGTNGSYWQAIPYPQWWMVDLGANYDIAKVVIRNYVDGNRYYQYEIWASTDNSTFIKIAEKTNTNWATNEGDTYNVTATARYLKVIMTKNSLNNGVHISDFRVYGSPHTSTWTGTANNNWYNTANWSGKVPTSTKDVIIPAAVTNKPVISASAVCNDLTINPSATLEIAPTGSLIVNGTLTNNAGIAGLVIKSDKTATGSIIENSGAEATVERYIANNWNWHLISSPIVSQDIWPQFAPAPSPNVFAAPGNWYFYYFNPNSPSADFYWVNLRKNNNGDYNDGPIDAGNSTAGFSDGSNTFPPKFSQGKGYLVAYNSGWTSGSPETHLFSGKLNSGPITRTLFNNSSGNAFNLVGNPYPSPIDWDLADGDSLWGRNGALAFSGQGYDYWVWDEVSEQYLYRNSSSQIGNAGQYIEPGQGFFVKAAENPAALTFGKDIRTHSAGKGWFKSVPTAFNSIRLKLANNTNSLFDEMFVDFNTNYSGLEGTQKFSSLYADVPEIYSVKAGINYSIDRYNQIGNNLTVNISTKCGITGIYTLTATAISGFQGSKNVYLEDLKTGNIINLKESPSYSFIAGPDDATERFQLSFDKSINVNNEPETIKQVYIYSFGKDVFLYSNMSDIGNCDIFIYNTIGILVYQGRYMPNSVKSKIATLNNPGTYILKVISHTGTTNAKIIIL